jgi:phage RecT family recombinase
VINVASIGLSLNPVLKHCALIPRYNNALKIYECHCDPMYQGLIAIATDGGSVTNVWAEVVRERDRDEGNFKYFAGTEPRVIHTPDPFMNEQMRGAVIGAYCVAEIVGSAHPKVEFMSIEQIESIRDKSELYKKKKSGPWVDWFEEMAKKTVIKRAQKTWPKGTGRLEKAVQLAHIADGYAEMEKNKPIDVKPVELISEEQAKELRAGARKAHLRVERIYKAFNIDKMEELPLDKYATCQKRINTAGLIHILKTATDEPKVKVSAKQWGMTYPDLEAMGAEYKTKASICE